ncbi:MAG TPA: glycine betaine ABC transporter substrate-binding protein [Bacilli bacterium]|nr:glycine betaine ABC transporter substrate-binding protein [Bacilli bacterium]
MKKMKALLVGALSLTLATGLVGCSALGGDDENSITVVGKNFTEQDLMANIVGKLLAGNTDLDVNIKSYLGGTDVAFNALKTGSADVYVEYTGTGLVNIMGEKVITDPDKAFQRVKEAFPEKYNIQWMEPIGFNNTYALAVSEETAKKYGLQKVSDLVKVQDKLVLGTEQEFIDRDDGYKGLSETYGLKFKDVKAMDPGLKYQALDSDQVDVIDAFTTDGRLVNYNLVLLEDDKQFFPPYYAVPLVREDTLKAHPEIGDVLKKLAGKIDEEEMVKLNAQVDVDKKKAEDVAEAWLKEEGLIK